MTRYLRRAVALTLCAALPACTMGPIRVDNVEYAHFDRTQPRELSSEACGVFILWSFFPARIRSRQTRAALAIQEQAQGAVLTNVRVRERWMWMLVATMLCTEISATAYPRLH